VPAELGTSYSIDLKDKPIETMGDEDTGFTTIGRMIAHDPVDKQEDGY
jgi:hypothetical protein